MATKMLNDFLIGCDPEFVGITDKGTLVNFKNRLPKEGSVGYDHGGWVGEIRPEPSRGTYMLLKKIQKSVLELPKFQSVKKLRGGAYVKGIPDMPGERAQVCIGGHVHLDLNPFRADGSVHPEHDRRVKALDAFTRYVEALDILPKVECTTRRRASQYGRFGDVRASNGRMEYRTMASWLFHPVAAMICLTGAKLSVVDPEGTIETLVASASTFGSLKTWFERYRSKDTNARRVCDRLLEMGHKKLVISPEEDFRESWKELPC